MIRFPIRSKIAAIIVLFFLGTFAGQLQHLLDSVRGKVDAGTRVTEEVRGTVGQAKDAATNAVDVVADLTNQIADLQAKLAGGTATPAQVTQLQGLVERLRTVAGRPGTPGPAGPTGATGPPGPPAATSPAQPPSSSTSTTAGGTTSTTRPAGTTTTTRRPTGSSSTTTTTRCTAGVGRLVRIGC